MFLINRPLLRIRPIYHELFFVNLISILLNVLTPMIEECFSSIVSASMFGVESKILIFLVSFVSSLLNESLPKYCGELPDLKICVV